MMDLIVWLALYHTRCYSLMQNRRPTYLQTCCKHSDQAFWEYTILKGLLVASKVKRPGGPDIKS